MPDSAIPTVQCGHCAGSGAVPIPLPVQQLYKRLQGRELSTVAQLYDDMPRAWRKAHTRNNINRYLGQLASIGLAEQVGKSGRSMLWRATGEME